ncbi:TRAP transporter small permease [Rossellomorea marisflavi]|uniref:TRAP transporter small permease n=1 Tax=Rossellomorea marisflavi TaxID=189381 RepID=UPI00069DB8FE|nr:TRAP transporter small permease [Rossellomorea marisflavi]
MKNLLMSLSNKLDRISRGILIICFVTAFVLTVYQVFARFVLQNDWVIRTFSSVDFSLFNLPWGEELIRYLFVWIVFLGIGIVYKSKGHAQVEILHHYLSNQYKKVLTLSVEIINSMLFLLLIIYGAKILEFTSQQVSPAMGVNMTVIYASLLVAASTCFVHSISNLAAWKQDGVELGEEDPMEVEEVHQQVSQKEGAI